MIYTSYYAVVGRIPKNIVPISISKGIPSWYHGEGYGKLAPRWDTVMKYKNGGSWQEYTEEYYSTVLDNLMPEQVQQELMRISGGRDMVLLCYEKSSDNCHRHLVAEWFRSHGIECKEYVF